MKFISKLFIIWIAIALSACSGSGNSGTTSPSNNAQLNTPISSESLKIFGGYAHVCVVTKEKKVDCWGNNSYGQANVPSDLEDVKALALGFFNVCALTTEGKIQCWGRKDKNLHIPPVELTHAEQIVATTTGFCGLQKGRVFCWGDKKSPTNLDHDVIKLASSFEEICATLRNGTITCWGERWTNYDKPELKTLLEKFSSAKEFATTHSATKCGLLGNVLKCLSTEKVPDVEIPFQKLNNPKNLQTNYSHACVEDDSEIKCFRFYKNTIYSNERPLPERISNAVTYSLGDGHLCVVFNDMNIKCWGQFYRRDKNYMTGQLYKENDPETPVFVLEKYGGQSPVLPVSQMKPISPVYCKQAKPAASCRDFSGLWQKEGISPGAVVEIGQIDCSSINALMRTPPHKRRNETLPFNFSFTGISLSLAGVTQYLGLDEEGVDVFAAACIAGNDLFFERLYSDHTELYQFTGDKLCHRKYTSSDTFIGCDWISRRQTY